jgi:hypothetical protein
MSYVFALAQIRLVCSGLCEKDSGPRWLGRPEHASGHGILPADGERERRREASLKRWAERSALNVRALAGEGRVYLFVIGPVSASMFPSAVVSA